MIAHTRSCACCGEAAIRWGLSRRNSAGRRRRIYLCGRCPTPSQIDRTAREISLNWSDYERELRAAGSTRQGHKDHHGRDLDPRYYAEMKAWTPPRCEIVYLIGDEGW